MLVAVADSAPLPVGAAMYVAADGAIEGSITGGCVESAVVHEAMEVLAGGPPAVHTYGISDELAGTAGLTCGGTVHVFVHALSAEDAAAVGDAYAAVRSGAPAALATVLDGDAAGATIAVIPEQRSIVVAEQPETTAHRAGPRLLWHSVGRDAAGLLDQGVTAIRSYGADGATLGAELRVFVRSFASPPRMVIFGAIDFSAALATIASGMGWQVTIADPRRAFLSSARFSAHAETIAAWPDA
ncbi:MAG TPA: XdhC family protein, partial [Conexibacter sp.]|nr:XdhC family protein [Conexibacter sp.]